MHVLENVSCQPGTVHTVFDTSAPERRDVGAMAAALPAEAAQGQLRGGRRCGCAPAPAATSFSLCRSKSWHLEPHTPLPELLAGAMGIDAETWSQLETGVDANEGTTIRPVGGDECRKRCGLQ